MTEWHVSPLEIEGKWSEEFYWLMLSRWLARKKEEAKAHEKNHAGKPKRGGIIRTPEGGLETTSGMRVIRVDRERFLSRLSDDYNPTSVVGN